MSTLEEEHRAWLAERRAAREREQGQRTDKRPDTGPPRPDLIRFMQYTLEAARARKLTWDAVYEVLPPDGSSVNFDFIAQALNLSPWREDRAAILFALRNQRRIITTSRGFAVRTPYARVTTRITTNTENHHDVRSDDDDGTDR